MPMSVFGVVIAGILADYFERSFYAVHLAKIHNENKKHFCKYNSKWQYVFITQ